MFTRHNRRVDNLLLYLFGNPEILGFHRNRLIVQFRSRPCKACPLYSQEHGLPAKRFDSPFLARLNPLISKMIPRVLILLLGLVLISRIDAAENRVISLDGDGDYVLLPPNIFTNLTEATVEVWAKWDTFQDHSRIFEFGGYYRSMKIINHATAPVLRFDVDPRDFREIPPGARSSIRVNDLLRPAEWIHLAAVSGSGGMK